MENLLERFHSFLRLAQFVLASKDPAQDIIELNPEPIEIDVETVLKHNRTLPRFLY